MRRFVRKVRGCWRFQRGKTQQRMLVATGLAERASYGRSYAHGRGRPEQRIAIDIPLHRSFADGRR